VLEIVEGEAVGTSGCRPGVDGRLRLLLLRGAGQRGLLGRENTVLRRTVMPPG
jgi:hypothetical protein